MIYVVVGMKQGDSNENDQPTTFGAYMTREEAEELVDNFQESEEAYNLHVENSLVSGADINIGNLDDEGSYPENVIAWFGKDDRVS